MGQVVLVVLPPCAKIAPVEDPYTAALQPLSDAFGAAPDSCTREGRWTLCAWRETDSTNSRALQALRSAPNTSLDHVALTVDRQTAGRGQQHRQWSQASERDIALTLILTRNLPSASPFALNLAVSLAALEAIEAALHQIRGDALQIKWPNDIFWKGRKAGGILIENSWRGARWSSAVIGIGINLAGQPAFPNATRLLSPDEVNSDTVSNLRSAILDRTEHRLSELGHPEALLQQFHQRLYGWGQAQRWQLDGTPVSGVLESIDLEGRLCVSSGGRQHCFSPGEVGWLGLEP